MPSSPSTAREARQADRKCPNKLHADKAYSSRANRRGLRERGITPRIARPGIESSERLGRYRWVVERTLAWLGRFRRLAIRYERRADSTWPSWISAVPCCASPPSSTSDAARRSQLVIELAASA